MKVVILVGDGMGDEPIAELGGRTPLEAARTPAMDFVASRGRLYRLRTVPEGYPPGSDVANLSLLGYRPEECYTGRAPLEAASLRVTLAANETAFRCNLVTLETTPGNGRRMIDYSSGHISTAEARELILALESRLGDGRFRFHPGVSYRHLLVCAGNVDGLETVPPHDHSGRDVTSFWRAYDAHDGFRSLLDGAEAVLANHPVNARRVEAGKAPANSIWLWGQGQAPRMETLERRFGVRGSLISAVDLLKGIAVCAGMEVINVPGATGYLDTNYAGKASAAIEATRRSDLVFVHVEAPDEAGHQGGLAEKLQAIEDFDAKIVRPVLDGLVGTDFRLVVTMDHYTPLSLRTHAAVPVPVAVYDSCREGAPTSATFTEKSAAEAPLLPHGQAFMDLVLGRAA